ncbi:MAG: sigma-70 family RNA polymerase sigma factor [Phycisphaeraceae bacterium]|nr:sigma-70 family RNA polymerase sigma factor [Phycisphaeraceae bacterium]
MPDSILQQVAQGDPASVQACIDRYSGLVWSLARKRGFNPTECEDAVQEIFLDVWKSAGRFDPTVASEATFIAMIARRRLIDRRRRLSRRPESAEFDDRMGPVENESLQEIEVSEEAAAAAAALETLRPEQQRVLRLSIYQGLSHERIAESTGLPLGTVKTHVRRGLIRLREILGQQGEDGAGTRSGGAAAARDERGEVAP